MNFIASGCGLFVLSPMLFILRCAGDIRRIAALSFVAEVPLTFGIFGHGQHSMGFCEMLDSLTEEAKKSPRLCMNRDMRTQASCSETGHEDASQRMLNALEPGTVVPVHRHPLSTETVCVLRGAVRQSLFEEVSACVAPEGYAKRAQAILDVENPDCSFVAPEAGLPRIPESDMVVRERSLKLVEQFVVEAGSSCPMYVVPAGVWHTTEALASGTIIFEAKDGKYGEDGSVTL